MRMTVLAAVAAFSLGTAFAVSTQTFAQTGEMAPMSGRVFGYQDASTGTFRPARTVAPDVTAAPSTGTILTTLTINLASAFPAGFKIVCGAEVDGQSIDTTNGTEVSFEESSASVATVSGRTATCTVKTPYSWTLPSAGPAVQDFVTGEYQVTVFAASSAVPQVLRSTSGPFLHLTKIPAIGTVTSVPVSVTL